MQEHLKSELRRIQLRFQLLNKKPTSKFLSQQTTSSQRENFNHPATRKSAGTPPLAVIHHCQGSFQRNKNIINQAR